MNVNDERTRLRGTKLSDLLLAGHLAGWRVGLAEGTIHYKLFNLPDVDMLTESLLDVELSHPLTDVHMLVRFRAELIGGHPGVYKVHAARCTTPRILRNGGSADQVLAYVEANSMGCPR